jgi:TRAP-type C4-dicarboxylate transport system permease small subunit
MDGIAAVLDGWLSGLPSAGSFLLVTLPLLTIVTGGFFLLRGTRFVSGLAAGLDRVLTGIVATVLLAMVFLSGLQILLRNVFASGLGWIDPLLRHLVLLLAFVGAILATGAKRHVQINVLGRLLHGVPARVSGALIGGLAGTISLLLAYASLELLRDEVAFGEIAFLSVPSWVVVGIFPTAFLAMAFRFLHLAFEEAAGVAPVAPEEEIAGAEGEGT